MIASLLAQTTDSRFTGTSRPCLPAFWWPPSRPANSPWKTAIQQGCSLVASVGSMENELIRLPTSTTNIFLPAERIVRVQARLKSSCNANETSFWPFLLFLKKLIFMRCAGSSGMTSKFNSSRENQCDCFFHMCASDGWSSKGTSIAQVINHLGTRHNSARQPVCWSVESTDILNHFDMFAPLCTSPPATAICSGSCILL